MKYFEAWGSALFNFGFIEDVMLHLVLKTLSKGIAFSLLVVIPLRLHAEDDSQALHNTEAITWETPQTIKSDKQTKTSTIKLTGMSDVSAIIKIPRDLNKLEGTDDNLTVVKLPLDKVLQSSREFRVKENQAFEFVFELPEGYIQIPVQILVQNQEKARNTILSLEVKAKEVVLSTTTQHEKAVLKERSANQPKPAVQNYISLGAGMTFLDYTQSRDNLITDLKFQSSRGPSVYLGYRYRFNINWDVLGTFKYSPGTITNGDSILIADKSYSWSAFSLESKYTPTRWSSLSLWNRRLSLFGQAGLAYNYVPLIVLVTNTTAQVQYASTQLILAGLGLDYFFKPGWKLEMFMHYDFLFNTQGASFTSPLIFDGSLGVVTDLSNRFDLGLFWYGQYQRYDYVLHDASTGIDAHGKQVLLYSNVDLRLIWKF
ncbi:MAG: hypothetical protein ACXVCR_08780 [Bdellovibrio sp.]